MFEQNKAGFEINPPSIEESIRNVNDKEPESTVIEPEKPEIKVPDNIPQSMEIREQSNTTNETEVAIFTANVSDAESPNGNVNDHEISINQSFRCVLFEHGLKAVMVMHLVIGVVSAVTFVGRQIVVKLDVSNPTWQCVGLLRCLISIITIFMILLAKVLIHNNKEYLDKHTPENKGFFYSIIIISAALSWIHFLLCEFRNAAYYHNCAVETDIFIPVLQMLFIMVALMLISDLIFHRIKKGIPRKFYVVYKSAALLLFMNCISLTIFNILDIESTAIQIYIAKISNNNAVFCYHHNSTSDPFVALQKKTHKLLQGFPVILFVSCIAILLKPLEQFSLVYERTEEETETSMSAQNNSNVSTYTSTSIIYAIIAFIMAVIGIPLDMIKLDDDRTNTTTEKIQISYNVLPLCLMITVACLSVFLLKWLHDFYPRRPENTVYKVDNFIIWASLAGHLGSCFKYIINSSHFILSSSSTLENAVSGLRIILYIVDIIQSIMQALVMDLISHLRQDHPVSKKSFMKISQPVVLLIATSLGLLVTSLYLLSGTSSLRVHDDEFSYILWDVLGCFSDPMSIVFRGYSVVFLVGFLARMRHHNNNQ